MFISEILRHGASALSGSPRLDVKMLHVSIDLDGGDSPNHCRHSDL